MVCVWGGGKGVGMPKGGSHLGVQLLLLNLLFYSRTFSHPHHPFPFSLVPLEQPERPENAGSNCWGGKSPGLADSSVFAGIPTVHLTHPTDFSGHRRGVP